MVRAALADAARQSRCRRRSALQRVGHAAVRQRRRRSCAARRWRSARPTRSGWSCRRCRSRRCDPAQPATAPCWPAASPRCEADLVGLYDVFTASRGARAGPGALLCRGCLPHGAPAGALARGYLQVEADNVAGTRASTGASGFADGYAYHYRTGGPAGRLSRQLPRGLQATSRPRPSSRPRCTFMHCTAAPLAPLPRLSSRAISMACVAVRKDEDVAPVGVVARLHVEVAVVQRGRIATAASRGRSARRHNAARSASLQRWRVGRRLRRAPRSAAAR